jgi:hypothetical protein
MVQFSCNNCSNSDALAENHFRSLQLDNRAPSRKRQGRYIL